MQKDAHGLALTTGSAAAAAAFDHAVAGYAGFRADLPHRMATLLAEDPDFALAHCLRGYLCMLSFSTATLGEAREALAAARRVAPQATPREQAHVAALEAWTQNRIERTLALWDWILAESPRDALALRLAHYGHFWSGRPDRMRDSVDRAALHWTEADPAWAMVQACRCFAAEECAHYVEAERMGLAALEADPGDLWAAHGVAHVLEMQGRTGEGIFHIAGLRARWDGANNVRHHLFWHEALFHLRRGDAERVLELYDTDIRGLDDPLTRAQPDLYIDVQNAASILFRLQLRGEDVGDRWTELADKAEARIGDCLSGFTLPHWMMALAATGRFAAGEQMLRAMSDYAHGEGDTAALVARYALPVCTAVLAFGRGENQAAAEAMRPALAGMYRLGGSHAQQDVLEQLFLNAAMRAGMLADVRMMLERASARKGVPPARRVGYAAAARNLGFA